jgi:natural product biosynthesis luciferase-like monooxygenase protein
MTHPTAIPRLSLFFFATEDKLGAPDRYEFILEACDLAEQLGFEAVWLPERHFHPFGGLFPNPAVLASAVAARTERIALRAGSVVVPLHHPVRIVEDWAMVDVLSGGRVGLSLATGWNQGDFVLGHCDFEDRRQHTLDSVRTIQRLWSGETLELAVRSGATTDVRVFPRPARARLPLWLTATSGSTTFREAGERGLNVLTAYLQQETGQLTDNLRLYRDAHSARGHVTLMVHAFTADTDAEAIDMATGPLMSYLDTFLDLNNRGHRLAESAEEELTDEEKRELAEYSAGKYLHERSLIGGPAHIADRLRFFGEIGVDELACFVDFGLPADTVLSSLRSLGEIANDVAGSRVGVP